MLKRGNKSDKRAQFYLISALVLAAVVIGIVTIQNYSKKELNIELQDLKEELQIESAYVMDYGLYKKLNWLDFYRLLINFAGNYTDYEGKGKDLYFIFGNKDNITVTGSQETEKKVSVSSGVSQLITDDAGTFNNGINPGTDTIFLSIDDASYEFKINEGENFYFILSQKINKGEYVIIG